MPYGAGVRRRGNRRTPQYLFTPGFFLLPNIGRENIPVSVEFYFTHMLVKSSPELLSAATAGYLLRAFHTLTHKGQGFRDLEERVFKRHCAAALEVHQMSVTGAALRS